MNIHQSINNHYLDGKETHDFNFLLYCIFQMFFITFVLREKKKVLCFAKLPRHTLPLCFCFSKFSLLFSKCSLMKKNFLSTKKAKI